MGGLSNSRGNSRKSAPVKNSHGNSQESAPAKNIRGNSKSAAFTRHTRATIWMILPLYIFTLIFVACPLIYMVALSFATPGEVHGVQWIFTLDNYRKLLEPVYLDTFVQSFQLAITSTVFITLIGYPFGYFMAKLPAGGKKKSMLLLMLPFWVNSLIRLYGWIIILQKKRRSEFCAEKAWPDREAAENHVQLPGNRHWYDICVIAFMILSVYSSAEKLDWSYVEAARDLGASRLQAFFTVSLKLTLPGLLSGVILTFIPSMGLFLLQIFWEEIRWCWWEA